MPTRITSPWPARACRASENSYPEASPQVPYENWLGLGLGGEGEGEAHVERGLIIRRPLKKRRALNVVLRQAAVLWVHVAPALRAICRRPGRTARVSLGARPRIPRTAPGGAVVRGVAEGRHAAPAAPRALIVEYVRIVARASLAAQQLGHPARCRELGVEEESPNVHTGTRRVGIGCHVGCGSRERPQP
eukprot:scaffold5358_cov68-Phaeocystis_antarctica.AAC.3